MRPFCLHKRASIVLLAGLLGACAGGPMLPGLRSPPPAQPVARNVTLRMNAATRLNLEKHGQPLALVVRIYQLRQRTAFDAAPYAAFLAPDAERAALGTDLVEVRELTLVPGQRVESTQQLGGDTGFVGIVALFHTPAARGWRISMPAAEAVAERGGLALELGACAMRRSGDGIRSDGVRSGATASGSLVRCQ